MTTTTHEITQSEMNQAQRLAEAEQAWDASATKSGETNPFSGSTERARKLEAVCILQRRKAKGESLRAAMAELASYNAEIKRLSVEVPAAKAELDLLEQRPVLIRWKKARAIAFSIPDIFGQWERYSKWCAGKGATSSQRISELQVPSEKWPASIRFDDPADQEIIWKHKQMQGAQANLEQERSSANSRREALLHKFPELEGIK